LLHIAEIEGIGDEVGEKPGPEMDEPFPDGSRSGIIVEDKAETLFSISRYSSLMRMSLLLK